VWRGGKGGVFGGGGAATPPSAGRITRADSRLPAFVIPTDEERVIARETMALLSDRSVVS
jgi:acetate kinase